MEATHEWKVIEVSNDSEAQGRPTPPDQLPRTGTDQFGETRKGLDAVSYTPPVSAGPLDEMPVPPIASPQASAPPDSAPATGSGSGSGSNE